MNVQAIIFDFDGVILESMEVKGDAFGLLFADYPEHLDEIVTFHFNNGGMSRFDKFRYIYKYILKKTLSEKEFDQLCTKFSKIVFNRVLECEYVPGANRFLKKYFTRIPFFIVSATPDKEIVEIVNAKGLARYFKGVFGSPTTKEIWVKKIIKDHNFDPLKVLYIGDAISDYDASRENNTIFIARVYGGNSSLFEEVNIDAKVKDLLELERIVSELVD